MLVSAEVSTAKILRLKLKQLFLRIAASIYPYRAHLRPQQLQKTNTFNSKEIFLCKQTPIHMKQTLS